MERLESEVELTQYMMPNGREVKVYCDVGKELADMAREKGMMLSTEMLMTGAVAVYGRLKGQDEEDELCEIADNFESDKSPDKILKDVIKRLNEKSSQEENSG